MFRPITSVVFPGGQLKPFTKMSSKDHAHSLKRWLSRVANKLQITRFLHEVTGQIELCHTVMHVIPQCHVTVSEIKISSHCIAILLLLSPQAMRLGFQ